MEGGRNRDGRGKGRQDRKTEGGREGRRGEKQMGKKDDSGWIDSVGWFKHIALIQTGAGGQDYTPLMLARAQAQAQWVCSSD